MVLNIARGKDSVNICLGGIRLRQEVSAVIHIDMTLKKLSIRCVANGHENTVNRQIGSFIGFNVLELDPGYARWVFLSTDLFQDGIPYHFYFFVGEKPVL